jgi:hypothetical protein
MLMPAGIGLGRPRSGSTALALGFAVAAMLCAAPAAGQSVRIGVAKTPYLSENADTVMEAVSGLLRASLGGEPITMGNRFLWGTGEMPRIQLGLVTNNDALANTPHKPPKVDLVFDVEKGGPETIKLRVFAWDTAGNPQGAYMLLVSDELAIDKLASVATHERLRPRLAILKARAGRQLG